VKIGKYGVKQPEDFVHFEKEDWNSLAIPPFQRNKIMEKILQLVPKPSPIPTPIQTPIQTPIPSPIPTIPQSRQERCRDPPTSRLQPGRRFLTIVPNAATDQDSIISALTNYSNTRKPTLDQIVIQHFKDKIEDFTLDGHPPSTALSFSLCWLYTANSWVYQHVNELLREDSSSLEILAPFMNGLMRSYKFMASSFYYSGVVYRRTKMSSTGVAFYKPSIQFVWSAFTSTTVDFSTDNSFGDVLFVITIPPPFQHCALILETLSAFPSESEVLLLPNVGFLVNTVTSGSSSSFGNTSTVIVVQVAYVCVAS